jgi:hypothetical protein
MDTVKVIRDDPTGAEGLGIKAGDEALVMQRFEDGLMEVILLRKEKRDLVGGLVLMQEDVEAIEEGEC